jgi:drug/metabolite transporter (DMT)-like permease
LIAVLGGLGAAVAWACAAVAASRSTRIIGPASALGWGMLIGILVCAVPLGLAGVPELTGERAGWLAVSGVGNMLGLLLLYVALRIGKVGVVVPIGSTSGGIAAVIAVAAGESVSAGIGVALVALAAGAVLASSARGESVSPAGGSVAPGVAFAAAAALVWGVAIYAGGRLSSELPLAWVLVSTRAVGVLAVTIPLGLTRKLRFDRLALPFLVVAGVGEVAGYASFLWGARDGIAVSSVLAGQNAALAALIAYLLFRERLARIQVAGVALIGIGIAALAVLQA